MTLNFLFVNVVSIQNDFVCIFFYFINRAFINRWSGVQHNTHVLWYNTIQYPTSTTTTSHTISPTTHNIPLHCKYHTSLQTPHHTKRHTHIPNTIHTFTTKHIIHPTLQTNTNNTLHLTTPYTQPYSLPSTLINVPILLSITHWTNHQHTTYLAAWYGTFGLSTMAPWCSHVHGPRWSGQGRGQGRTQANSWRDHAWLCSGAPPLCWTNLRETPLVEASWPGTGEDAGKKQINEEGKGRNIWFQEKV